MNDFRVPILREVGDEADESDPDHIRGAKYANLLLGTDYGRGDVVEMFYIDRVRDRFFQRVESERPGLSDKPLYRQFKRGVSLSGPICVDDTDLLPDEFDVISPEMKETVR